MCWMRRRPSVCAPSSVRRSARPPAPMSQCAPLPALAAERDCLAYEGGPDRSKNGALNQRVKLQLLARGLHVFDQLQDRPQVSARAVDPRDDVQDAVACGVLQRGPETDRENLLPELADVENLHHRDAVIGLFGSKIFGRAGSGRPVSMSAHEAAAARIRIFRLPIAFSLTNPEGALYKWGARSDRVLTNTGQCSHKVEGRSAFCLGIEASQIAPEVRIGLFHATRVAYPHVRAPEPDQRQ